MFAGLVQVDVTALLLCYPLWQACVEVSCLIDVEPAHFLLHDVVEEQSADAVYLTSWCQRPQGHLKEGWNHCREAQNAVGDGITEWKTNIDRHLKWDNNGAQYLLLKQSKTLILLTKNQLVVRTFLPYPRISSCKVSFLPKVRSEIRENTTCC